MLKILIADDDMIIRRGLKTIIEKRITDCMVVGQAPNGIEALELIEMYKPHILIADIKMPGMNGVELVKQLKIKGENIRTIILSGFDEYQYVRETMKNGAVDYLLKPIENDILIDIIEKIRIDLKEEEEKENKMQLLNEKANKGMEVLKQKYLLELISDFNYKHLENLGIETVSKYIIAIINVDDYYKLKLMNNLSIEFYINIVQGFMKKILRDGQIIDDFLITANEAEIIVMFISCTANEEILKDNAEVILENLRTNIENNHEFNITIGLSGTSRDIENIKNVYDEAFKASERKFFEGKNKVIGYDKVACSYNSLENFNVEDVVKKITNSLDITDNYQAQKYLDIFIMRMDEQKLSPESFKKCLKDLIHKLSANLGEINEALSIIYTDEFDVYYYIDEINTHKEVYQYLSKLINTLVEKIKFNRSLRSNKVVEIIKEYIKEHYKENISLKSAAEHVSMNYTYLSELFKNETKKNFMDYVIETRINESKKLLKDSNIKVYEIGYMVGYEEPASFNRVFKKIIGLSPAEYRKIIK